MGTRGRLIKAAPEAEEESVFRMPTFALQDNLAIIVA